MKKRKRILWLPIFLAVFVALMFLIRLFTGGGIAGFRSVRYARAELFVNGERAEKPAVLWWYNYGSAKPPSPEYKVELLLPFYATLEALGFQIDRDEKLPISDAAMVFGDSRLFFEAETMSLYRDGELLLSHIAHTQQAGGRGVKGQLFFNEGIHPDDVTYADVLKALGFDRVETDIDRDSLIVRITAVSSAESADMP